MSTSAASGDQRIAALRDLVEMRIPVVESIEALSRFDWDSDDELVILVSGDALRVLNGYLSGTLSREEVEQWADALEVRDDVGREPEFEEELGELLFQLATPDVAGELVPDLAKEWIEKLRR